MITVAFTDGQGRTRLASGDAQRIANREQPDGVDFILVENDHAPNALVAFAAKVKPRVRPWIEARLGGGKDGTGGGWQAFFAARKQGRETACKNIRARRACKATEVLAEPEPSAKIKAKAAKRIERLRPS